MASSREIETCSRWPVVATPAPAWSSRIVVVASTVTGTPPAAGSSPERSSRPAASPIASWRRCAAER
jgi:hypothetical protein